MFFGGEAPCSYVDRRMLFVFWIIRGQPNATVLQKKIINPIKPLDKSMEW